MIIFLNKIIDNQKKSKSQLQLVDTMKISEKQSYFKNNYRICKFELFFNMNNEIISRHDNSISNLTDLFSSIRTL